MSETVWNWDGGYGSGGGISTTYPIPSWQEGISMTANNGSTTMRNIPDVAMTADNVWVMFGDGSGGSVGGTSCATPLWAGFTALINQQAATYGQPAIGFMNPLLYALCRGPGYSAIFHDITTGSDTNSCSPTNFFATPGYDLCSGWGTPNGTNLINALAPFGALQITPGIGFETVGGIGGPFNTVSENFALTNSSSATLSWKTGNTASWLNLIPALGTLTPGGGTTVTAVLNLTASNLFLGTYAGTIWFTNLTDGTVQSRNFALTILKPPLITVQPTNMATIAGATATFTATAAGGLPMSMQWQFNGTNLTNGGQIFGAQASISGNGNIYGAAMSVLTLSNAGPANIGTYTLVANNVVGTAFSSNAVLSLTASPPVIVMQPSSQILLAGTSGQFTVNALGSSPLSYNWRFNQTNLTGEGNFVGSTSAVLSVSNLSSANIGSYSVVISNYLGSVTSSVAQMQVLVQKPGVQMVPNGGFETGDFSPWGGSGNFTDCSVSSDSLAVHSGNYGALLGPAGSLGYLSQSLPTVAGQLYLLSLWLDSPDGISPNEFQAGWNGTPVFDETDIGAIGWTNLQFYVTATGANTVLQFGFRDDASFFGLDDIQVLPFVSANGPPIIFQQPASNLIVVVGATASFDVSSTGQLPLGYQWLFDGVDIGGATNQQLTLASVSTNQSGIYGVLVTNSLGSVVSSNAQLTVVPGIAGIINFDDLNGGDVLVPPGYGGLTWSSWNNFYSLDGLTIPNSGYSAGVVSPPNVVYNINGNPATITNPIPFDLISAYLTSAWNDGLRLEVKGWAGTTLAYDNAYTLSATTPSLITFDYLNVTTLEFVSSGGTLHPGYTGSGEEFVMDNVSVVLSGEPTQETLYSFIGPDGGSPNAIVQGRDGNFYGTTEYGGPDGDGTVFRMTTNGVLVTLASFNYSNGANPQAGLVQGDDGNFYGTTTYGGTFGEGSIFRMSTNGALVTLASFNYSDGAYPYAGVAQGTNGDFYGTTESGGTYEEGTVFRMTTNGVLVTLVSFNNSNGSYPQGGLVQGNDGNFYGTTEDGGTNGEGTVFRITTNGALTTIVSFNDSDGAYPHGGLAEGGDGNFYGTTEGGGTNDEGTVFRLTTKGVLTTIVSFNYSDGANPQSGLMQGNNGNFYGTTETGGSHGNGTLFQISSNDAVVNFSFAGTNGANPQAALVQGNDGNLYGTTAYGGVGYDGWYANGDGTVFCVQFSHRATPLAITAQPASQTVRVGGTAGFSVHAASSAPTEYYWQCNGVPIPGATGPSYTTFITNNVQLSLSGSLFSCLASNSLGSILSSNAVLTVLPAGVSGPTYMFSGYDGGQSEAVLVKGRDGNFYGTTAYGGTNDDGTVFRMTTKGLLTTLASFNYSDGAYPYAGVAQGTDGDFYGTTESGGTYEEGTVFRMTSNGVLVTLASFNYSDGTYPDAGVVQGTDGAFYGTTKYGGTNGDGTVFRVTTNGVLTSLVSFNNSNGSYPQGGLVPGNDGNFYGTTEDGGTNGEGTVFRITTNGALTTIVSFDNTNGANPQAGLVQGNDGNFYGTTENGTNYFGTVFRLTTNGVLTTLVSFNYSDGAYPQAGLVQGNNGNFYGTTETGGSHGNGTVFQATIGGTMTNIFSFAGTNGASPQAALVQGNDGNLYGTTTYGGVGYDGQYNSGAGTIFLVISEEPPAIVTQPLNQVVTLGSTVSFGVNANGSQPLYYFWKRNHAFIANANQNDYIADNVQISQSGSQFSCLVSNAFGSVLSSNAVLTVLSSLLPKVSSVHLTGPNLQIQALNGITGWTYYVLTSTNLSLPLGQWTPVATNILSAGGNFTITITNTVSAGVPEQFYILQSP